MKEKKESTVTEEPLRLGLIHIVAYFTLSTHTETKDPLLRTQTKVTNRVTTYIFLVSDVLKRAQTSGYSVHPRREIGLQANRSIYR